MYKPGAAEWAHRKSIGASTEPRAGGIGAADRSSVSSSALHTLEASHPEASHPDRDTDHAVDTVVQEETGAGTADEVHLNTTSTPTSDSNDDVAQSVPLPQSPQPRSDDFHAVSGDGGSRDVERTTDDAATSGAKAIGGTTDAHASLDVGKEPANTKLNAKDPADSTVDTVTGNVTNSAPRPPPAASPSEHIAALADNSEQSGRKTPTTMIASKSSSSGPTKINTFCPIKGTNCKLCRKARARQ